jgi:hypothetical protein
MTSFALHIFVFVLGLEGGRGVVALLGCCMDGVLYCLIV